ncbi:MarR family transcriptional regulator [Mycobacteroides abscessus subsp. abscessus]|nr:MarR family transcriptional regulator [Mycobacteroides abscessus subsp. abscessus]
MTNEYSQLKLENQLCFLLYAASREMTKQYKPLLDKLEVTYPQYLVLLLLWEKKSLTVKKLGDPFCSFYRSFIINMSNKKGCQPSGHPFLFY